jgi:23S rRNA (guanosine2251-2'-O)-methyltransferase
MVERSRRGKKKRKLLGSHARSWLWGRNLVRETLLAGRWPILELHVADDLPSESIAEAQREAEARGVPIHIERRTALQRLEGTGEHQGYLAKMGPFPYATESEVFAVAKSKSADSTPLFLILDSIQDPFNFGAMLRSAEAFGADVVFIGARDQAPVSSMVARSSAGAVNRVPVAQMEDLVALARTLHDRGIQVVGASEKAERAVQTCNLKGPMAVIIGNEGTGIRPDLAACCDALVKIPIEGAVGSLNAAAAAAVMLYEARRQRS